MTSGASRPVRVSIGVPVYNGEEHLKETLESILAQSYTDFELIVLDNASTDSTPDIVRSYQARDARVRYHRNAENMGAGPNHNAVFRLAKGEYFQWASSDNVFEPTLVERCVDLLDSDESLVLAFSRTNVIDDFRGETIPIKSDYTWLSSPHAYARVRNLFIEVIGMNEPIFGVIRSSVLADTSLLRSFIGSDDCLLIELGLKGRFGVVDEYLIGLRTHKNAYHAIKKRKRGELEDSDEAIWFDPANRGARVYPHWKRMKEFGAVIRRSAASPAEKTRMLAFLLKVGKWRRSFLANEALSWMRGS